MRYKLKAYDIYNIGQRDNQEDSLFPSYGELTDDDRLFIVCDGMGGHSAGEVASSVVCDTMSKSVMLGNPDFEGVFSKEDFEKALSAAYDELDKNDDGAFKKMGTTMTFLKLHSKGCTIAHIGDSRVYHIRPGKTAQETVIKHKTYDHSLVNDLIRLGELTEETAKTSSVRNVIMRAMQPGLVRRPMADIYETVDIHPGDYFMLCTDGVLENMDDETILHIFSNEIQGAKEKRDKLVELIQNNKDNQTAIIIHITDVIDSVVAVSQSENKDCLVAAAEEKDASSIENSRFSYEEIKRYSTIAAVIAVIALIGFIIKTIIK